MKCLVILFVILAIYSVDSIPLDSLIKENTIENIEKLKHLGEDEWAQLYSGQYQGDMVMSEDEIREYESGRNSKVGLIASRYQWAGGVVPYSIVVDHFTPEQVDYIHLGVRKMEEVTCLKFVPYNPNIHNDFVNVTGSSSGCFSQVGRRGTGAQVLNLQPFDVETGCFRLYTIIHEFIHAIGFYHMQSSPDRDEFVEIIWDKIQSGTENNFQIQSSAVVTNYGVDYDYGSVMHYPATAFSIDGSPTIIAKKDLGGEVMGQQVRMSEKDILRMNRAYCYDIETTAAPPSTSNPSLGQIINNFINNILVNIFGGFRN